MTQIFTVLGPVDSDQLGVTLVHDHIRTRREPIYIQFPHLYDPEKDKKTAVDAMHDLQALGVKTICDPTVMGIGRDVRFVREVAEATGMQIVVSTGIYTYDDLGPHFASRSVDYMADAFVHDIEVGIQRTDIKAGFLKAATDEPGVTPNVEKILRAVARAHRRTGIPIMTHSYPPNQSGLRQQDVFEDEGVDLTHVLIGHSGDTDDLGYLERIAERGSFLGMDRYGMSDVLKTERRNKAVVEMCRLGYANRMMLSQDASAVSDRNDPTDAEMRADWNLTYVVSKVVPQLIALGVPPSAIDKMLGENSKRWLAQITSY